MLPHLPSAMRGGFYHERRSEVSYTQEYSPFVNGPIGQPLIAWKSMNCWGMEEYSGEVPLCTCPAPMFFLGQRSEVGKRDLSFDPYSHPYALASSVIRLYGLLRQAAGFATSLSPGGQGYLLSAPTVMHATHLHGKTM